MRTAAPAVRTAVQSLEPRALLAGNVTVSLNGPHLTVIGDTADNAIEVSLFENSVQVRGLNNTTINGGTSAFVVASNTDTASGNMLISTGAGNDTVSFVRNVKVNGHVTFIGSTGNDTFNAVNASFLKNIALLGNQGNDTFSIQDSTISGEMRIHGHQGNDLVSLTDLTHTGGLLVVGGGGNDGVSLTNVTAGSWVGLSTGRGDDDLAIRNSRITGSLAIRTRADEDVVMLDDNTFSSSVLINTGRNNDSVDVRNTNTFNGFFKVQAGDSRRDGGSDGDAVQIGTSNVFNAGRRIRSEEETSVSPSATNRIDGASVGLIARATAADNAAASAANTLTATASSSQSEQSTGGVLITRSPNVTISGTTTPGATVNLDTDGDGSFDDGTATADATGAYSTTVVVTRRDLYTSDSTTNDQLTGLQTIRLRSTVSGAPAADASVTVDFVQNTVVRFVSNLGTYEVELFDTQAPIAVANFLGYSARYEDSIIHRSVDNFVIQGGGFTINNGVIDNVPTDAPIQNEFNSARTNIRGTLSMALTGATPPATGNDVNSGTSQWFVNLRNNTNLDTATTKHTVFGRIIGNGMTVVDAIAAVNQTDLSTATGVSALNEVPQRNTFTEFTRTISGTVSTTANSTTVTGVGTKFTTELTSALGNPGGSRSRIQINGQTFNVTSITDDTTLTVSSAPAVTQSGQLAKTDEFVDDNFVRFSSIAEILDQP